MSLKLYLHERWETNRNKVFLSFLDFNPKARVVDLGCGDGKFTLRAKKKIGCTEIVGVDIVENQFIKLRDNGIIFHKVDLNDYIPFDDESFDVVISNQVIEHLFYPVKFLKEIYRILSPAGYAVISTENMASWDNILALLLTYTPFSMSFDSGVWKIGNPISPHEKEEVITESYHPHIRIFTWRGLIDLSKFLGYRLDGAVGSGHIFGTLGELVDGKRCRFITIKVRR